MTIERLLDERYGGFDSELLAARTALSNSANEVLKTILGHRSMRHYLPDPLDEALLQMLVAAAQSAASSSNLQAWSVVAVTDLERKGRLAEFAGSQTYVRDCPLLLIWLADLSRLDRTVAHQGGSSSATRFLEMYTLAVIDAALAAQNAVVAAESIGLGTVYIGGMRNQPEEVARELNLPSNVFAVFGLCIGWPDSAQITGIKPRLNQSAVLHREKYSYSDEAVAVESYNTAMADFQRGQHMDPVGWSARVSQRIDGPNALTGRDRQHEALVQRGFGLK